MATIAKTFGVRNGLDVANTIVLDSNRNISNIIGANVTTANATTINATNILTSAGLNVTDQANNARNQANTARDQANNAYAEANLKLNLTGGTVTGNINVNNYLFANGFYSTNKNTFPPNLSNTYGERLRLYDFEQAGHPNYAIGVEANYIWAGTDENNGGTGFKWYGNTTQAAVMRSNGTLQLSNTVEAKVFKANGTGTAIDASQGNILTNKVTGTEFAFLNGLYTVTVRGNTTQSADYTFRLPSSGGTNGFVLSTDGSGNSIWSNAIYELANTAYDQANTARNTANGAYAQANGSYAQSNIVYAQANTARDQANTARDQANTARTTANDAYGQANSSYAQANSARDQANTSYTQANNARDQANTARTTANDAYGQANSARDQANTARTTANDAYGAANSKLSTSGGSISGDLTITGNLTIQGNATTINVSNLNVNDSIILLANGSTGDADDIGFVGHIQRGATNTHVGFFRKATENRFYLFDNYETEPTNNVIDITGQNFRVGNLRLGIINANSYVTVDGLNVTDHANNAYGQANNARDQANTARDTANGAYVRANLVYGVANSAANTVRVSANGGSTLDSKQLNFINTASILVTVVQSSDGSNANVSFATTGAAVSDAYSQANAAYDQANTARTTANGAYAQANGAYAQANGAYAHANIVYAQANTARDQANTARDTANGAYGQANGAYAQANGAYAHANIVYAQANAARDQANTGYAQANSARDQANAAYADANTRVLKAGDTMTGLLTITTTGTGLAVANANVTSHLTVGTLNVRTNTVTTSTTGQVVLDTFALTAHASAKYFVQANSGTDYTVTEIIVVHDGTNIYLTEYGTIQSGPSIGTFSADISSGSARLLFTANNNVNTIRSVRYGVLVP